LERSFDLGDGINRSLGEIRETKHHLRMAYKKGYLKEDQFNSYIERYNIASKMLKNLEKSLINSQNQDPKT